MPPWCRMLWKIARVIRSTVDNNADRSDLNIHRRSRARRRVAARNMAAGFVPSSRPAAIVKAATNIIRAPARKVTSGVSARVERGNY